MHHARVMHVMPHLVSQQMPGQRMKTVGVNAAIFERLVGLLKLLQQGEAIIDL